MTRFYSWITGLLLPSCVVATTKNAITYSPIQPPSYPLAVRNPYLSTWLPGNQVAELPTARPQFWFGNELGWSILANVNRQTYKLFGATKSLGSAKTASVIDANFTSTHSIFTLTAGEAIISLDFFSPVSPKDYIRQSLPFSYLSVSVTPRDGSLVDVDIYSDIDESWTGSKATNCSYTESQGAYLYEYSANGATYSQSSEEMALWGKVVFAAHLSGKHDVSSMSGPSEIVQSRFQIGGNLSTSGTDETCRTGGAYGFAYRLGKIRENATVRYAVGVVRDEAINYLGAPQTHYYRSKFPDTLGAVTHFFEDYEAAAAESQNFDNGVQNTATSLSGQNYSDILALSTRQVMGGIDVTIPADTMDTSQVQAFIKEISSDGNLNTLDIIYPTFPFFYVYAPEYIKLMLDPVLKYLASGRYPNPWTIHDMGTNYPNATGHDAGKDEKMPIEETGNLFILLDAYEKATGDKSWAAPYKNQLLPRYADYLAQNGLYPENQLSTTDGLGAFANMTNLAIKAAVALSSFSRLTNQPDWHALGKSFAYRLSMEGVGVFTSEKTHEPYFDLTYGNKAWYLPFNIFPSVLLDLRVFSLSTFDFQSDFYPTVRSEHGVAICGGGQGAEADWGKTDWDMWVAATSLNDVRDMFINDIHAYISNGKNTEPFSDKYYVKGEHAGKAVFRARPTLGAHWAVWALIKGPNSG